jgi:hypothetical protein
MEDFLERLLIWLQSQTIKLLLLAVALLLIWGVFAPVGTLVWWLSQSAENLGLKKNQAKNLPSGEGSINIAKSRKINCYIIFLPGIGDFSADELTPGEEFFLNRLVEKHPNCVAVSDVFPYSAANKDLAGERLLAPLWGAVENAPRWLEIADILIKIRNLWRLAISADERYRPIYNQGIATSVIERMNAVHPIPQSPQQRLKLILIGTSGGAQIALGAASYLDEWLNAQLIVVSVGGSFDGETGFAEAEHVYHLQGSQDWVEDISSIVFPAHWALTVGSPINQARQQGRFTVLNSGLHAHSGSQGYFGTANVNGSRTKYVDLTLDKVNQLPIWSAATDAAPDFVPDAATDFVPDETDGFSVQTENLSVTSVMPQAIRCQAIRCRLSYQCANRTLWRWILPTTNDLPVRVGWVIPPSCRVRNQC